MMERGRVVFFNYEKGFGFVQPDSGADDLFLHVSILERAGITALADGQRVEFESAPPRQEGRNLRITEIRIV